MSLFFLIVGALGGSVFAPTPGAVRYVGNQLYVDGTPFYVQGLCYSPVPIGETVVHPPFGDYFTADYAYLWKRDLPLIKEMGVNTIRIYGWDTTHNVEHFEFLDEVHKYGLKVVLTFYVGRNNDNPPVFINTPELRQVPLTNFTREVALYGDHPAILMWSFGNELNGPWNGFLTQLAQLGGCKYKDYGRCWNNPALDAECLRDTDCLYAQFLGWLNDAAVQAKALPNFSRLVTSGLADLDRFVDTNVRIAKLNLYGHYAPALDVWAIQLYQGEYFTRFLRDYKANMKESEFKPLMVTEYGVDAFNDPCGWPENRGQSICRNMADDGLGGVSRHADGTYTGCQDGNLACSKPGDQIQLEWDLKLTKELHFNRVKPAGESPPPTTVPLCTGPYPGYQECQPRMDWMAQNWQKFTDRGVTQERCTWQVQINSESATYCPDPYASQEGLGIVGGGFLMAWIDERWKGNIPTQAYCHHPCNPYNISECIARSADFEPNKPAGCTFGSFNVLAHWECEHDTYYHGLCGYGFESMPDFYMNEEWFGLNVPAACGHFVPSSDGNPQHFGLDTLAVRPVMKGFQQWWAPALYAKNQPFRPSSCAELLPCWQCLRDHAKDADIKVKPAYLNACRGECDINPPAPTPPPTITPTLQPTNAPTAYPTHSPTAAPTTPFPTLAPTGSPTERGETPAPSPPPTKAPSLAPSVPRSAAMRLSSDQTLRYITEHFPLALAQFFIVPPERFADFACREDAGNWLIGFTVMPEKAPDTLHTDTLLEQLAAELEFLKLDSRFGCEGEGCQTYEGTLLADPLLLGLDVQYGLVTDIPPTPAPTFPGAPTPAARKPARQGGVHPGVIVGVAAGVLLVAGGGAFWFKRSASRKSPQDNFARLHDDDHDYAPPSTL